MDAPYADGLLGKFVAESGDRAGALALVDQGLRYMAYETGEHCRSPTHSSTASGVAKFLSAGVIPARLAAAEDAFETAIAVALTQGSRNFALRAALALAKLRNSNHRSAEAASCSRRGAAGLLADAGAAGGRRGPDAVRVAPVPPQLMNM